VEKNPKKTIRPCAVKWLKIVQRDKTAKLSKSKGGKSGWGKKRKLKKKKKKKKKGKKIEVEYGLVLRS